MDSGPYTLLLGAVPWDVFITLTYRDAPMTEDSVVRHVNAWLEGVRVRLRLHKNDFYNFVRVEGGEQFGRLHAHVLLRVPRRYRGLFVVPKPGVPWCAGLWARGYVTTRCIEGRQDPATLYVEKDTSGANEYETAKTAKATTSYPSLALMNRALLQKSALEAVQG